MVWDTLAIFAICLEICVSPLLLYRLTEMERSIADIFQWTLTAFWTLDIIASFFTATYVNDNLCFRLAEIAKAYLKSWFLFDITMLIPDFVGMAFDLEDGPAGIFRLLKARRILRLFRLVQILKVRRLLDRFQTARFKMRVGIGPLATPLLSATLVLVLAVHVLGSLWFAVGDTEKGWVRAEGLHTAGLGRQISRSLEWALSKLPPSSLRITVELQTPGERWLGIIGTCISLISGSVFVSFVTNTMANVTRSTIRTTQVLRSVQKYCGLHGISYASSIQIRRYIEREQRRFKLDGHMQLLRELPEGMLRELFQEARSQILHNHAFFREVAKNYSMDVDLCSEAVSEIYLLAADVVFDVTKKAQGMYMMSEGVGIYYCSSLMPVMPRRSETESKKSKASTLNQILPAFLKNAALPVESIAQTRTLEIGEHIAEPALWVKSWRYQGRFQSVLDNSQVLLVSTEDLFAVLQEHTEEMVSAIVYARMFMHELSTLPEGQVTDLPLLAQPKVLK